MTERRAPEITPHTAIGVSLALLGVVLTLDNLGFVDAHAVFRYWPLIPMLVGAAFVVQGREMREWVIGAGWMPAGTVFLLRNLDVFHFRLSDFLPLILVAVGVKVILGRSRRRHALPPGGPAPAWANTCTRGTSSSWSASSSAAGARGTVSALSTTC